MRKVSIFVLVFFIFAVVSFYSYAENSSGEWFRRGFLGATSGAVGGLASGAKGRDVWKGALAGMGVNILGGALLDSTSRSSNNNSQNYAYENERQVTPSSRYDSYSESYETGFQSGYKQGFAEGYQQAIKDRSQ